VVNGAIGRTNLPRKAENQEEEDDVKRLKLLAVCYLLSTTSLDP